MAVAQVSASLFLTVHDAFALSLPHNHTVSRLPFSNSSRIRTTFAGSPLLWRTSHQMMPSRKVNPVSIRCEQSAQDSNGLDVWLGRLAMVGFASAISVEIATGKGLLENFGLTTPLPTVALGVTALVGVLTAVFIFQSASKS